MITRIPESFISMLLNRTDIVELICTRVLLRKTGTNFMGQCPFHTEKTPSFSVSMVKQFYHCFGCRANGNAIQFLMEIDKLTFIEAVESLALRQGLKIPRKQKATRKTSTIYDVLSEASNYYGQQLRQHDSAGQAINYLKKRGLQGITAKRFHLGYAPPGWENLKQHILNSTQFTEQHLEQAGLITRKEGGGTYDRFRDRIIFPIRDHRGRVIGFGGRVIEESEPKYLNSPETSVFQKGNALYGLYEAYAETKLNRLILVEGYMDVLALTQAKIPGVVAALGTALTLEHVKLLFRIVPEIIFCFDSDKAGNRAAWSTLETCLPKLEPPYKIRFLFLPEGEDPDSFVNCYGQKAFLKKLTESTTLADFCFMQLSKHVDLEILEDRSNLAVKAQGLLQQLPEGIFKQMMFDKLAQLVNFDRNFLQSVNTQKRLFKRDMNNTFTKGKFFHTKKPPQPPRSPAMMALALLLINPNFTTLVDVKEKTLRECNLPGSQLFIAVATILMSIPQASAAEIAYELPASHATHFIYDELRRIARLVPEYGAKQEFQGAIAKMQAHYHEQELEKLLSKSETIMLSSHEKATLQQLLLKKSVTK